ncbi:MAG: hypothetical protein Kapaf2KO_06550 [Candidatus Kapaibacteriales bacterium]
MNEIVKHILEQLDAFQLHAELTEKLNDEKKKREWFYEKVDESVNAEFINGEIVLHSPAKVRHWKASGKLALIFGKFLENNALGILAVEKAMVSLTRNDYEPDICFF